MTGNITETGPSQILSTIEEVEARLQVLDTDHISPFYETNPLHELAGVIHRGYLWMKKDNPNKLTTNPWIRLWFALDETKLYCIKEGDNLNSPSEMKVVCDTMLASVRDLKDVEVPFCFEVAYANVKNFTLQAEGPKDHSSWLEAIKGAIEKRITSNMPAPQLITKSSLLSNEPSNGGMSSTQSESAGSQSTLARSVSSASSMVAAQQSRRKDMASLISTILRGNVTCAECGKDSPDWLSINLGCLICIDCSGVHRSLGVHISKVRSLSLDDLEPEEYSLVTRIGNKVSNSIWEASLPNDITKPEPNAPYQSREKFIRAKYQERSFLPLEGISLDAGILNLKLHIACLDDDVVEAIRALALGADVNSIVGAEFMSRMSSSSSEEGDVLEEERICGRDLDFTGSEMALHIAAKSGSLGCSVLLMQNGGDANVPIAESGKTALDYAQEMGFKSIHGYLSRKGENFKPTVSVERESSGGMNVSSISSSSEGNPKTLDPELLRRILF